MRRVCLLLLILFTLLASSVVAQSSGYTAYSWVDGDLALAYPSGWDAPVTSEQNGLPALHIAQALANAPDTRPPGIPFITFSFFLSDSPDSDVVLPLQAVLQNMTIVPGEPSSAVLLGFDAVAAQGFSDDQSLFGLGRAARLADGRMLVIAGRATAAQQATFAQALDTVANSLVQGAESEPVMPSYGVLWQTMRTLSDGEAAFVNLVGLTLGRGLLSNVLYAVDANAGVIVFEQSTGVVKNSYQFDLFAAPSDITSDTQGLVVYVSDIVCQCVQPFYDGSWSEPYYGFESGAPRSLAPYSDGFYATDLTETEGGVRSFNTQVPGSAFISFDDEVNDQPLLTTDIAGRLLALTGDGRLWMLEGESFVLLYELNTVGLLINDFAILPDGNILLATDNQGLLVINPNGEISGQIGRIVLNSPLPGDFVHPKAVAVGMDGTIFVADSDGTFGSVTAMSTRVQAGRMGSTALVPGVEVQGTLNAQTPQQDWTLAGHAGQFITISAVDNGGGMMDVSLRLIAPDGSELAANDDQEGTDLPGVTDAQLADLVLPLDGVYTVRVELLDGSGSYSLGVSREQSFELNASGATRLAGTITAALPVERWTFQGNAGQTLTFTMQAQGGTLDTILRLLDENNTVLAENDDADDTALGKDAQLVQVSLPADGNYTLEARRFDGVGDYSIVIVATS